jgi:hypothetical protein
MFNVANVAKIFLEGHIIDKRTERSVHFVSGSQSHDITQLPFTGSAKYQN